MKNEEIYNAWKQRKSQIEVSKGFTETVMNRVYQYEAAKGTHRFNIDRLFEFISARPLAKAALIVAGAMIGLGRLAYILVGLLGYCGYCG